MKSQSVASSLLETNAHPFGDAIVLFDFNHQPKLGTKSIRPGGTFIFTTPQFPLAEPLSIIGKTPFRDDNAFTNTPIRLIDVIEPKDDPYEFTVVFQGFSQQIFMRLLPTGVDAGELRWVNGPQFPQWRTALRLPGAVEKVQLIKELSPSSPFYNYQFIVYDEVSKIQVPVITTPNGKQEVVVDSGFFVTIAVPPSQAQEICAGPRPMEVGGTDAADLIISPGG